LEHDIGKSPLRRAKPRRAVSGAAQLPVAPDAPPFAGPALTRLRRRVRRCGTGAQV